MKKIITILICLVATSNLALCQPGINFNFDQDTNYKKYFYIDSSNVNNVWQVGKPQKTIFNAAKSAPNALVTDTVNHYRVNDTSSVTIIHIVEHDNYFFYFNFYYYIDSDTIDDFWRMEASIDNGTNWVRSDSIMFDNPFQWKIASPEFSGKSNGWKNVELEFFGSFSWQYYHGDTLLFRFVFITDSINNFRDGLMLDNIYIDEWMWSVEEYENHYAYKVFYKGNEEIELVQQDQLKKKGKTYIEITDLSGRTQYSFEVKDTPVNNFKMPGIKDGIYLYAIKNNNRLIQSGKTLVK